MKAIILAPDGVAGAPVLSERLGAAMLPLLDRPFLQHGVECLVRWGVTEVAFVLSHRPETVEALFGSGERWGCRFRYHLVRDPRRPYRPLADTLSTPRDAPLILAHGDALPLVGALPWQGDAPRLLMAEEGATDRQWPGWAVIPPGTTLMLDGESDRRGLETALRKTGAQEESIGPWLRVHNAGSLIDATGTLLELGVPCLMHGAREVEHGVWISRDVGLHPTARITPPVYIGEGCRIGRKAAIGPHAVLCKGCVVDETTQIDHSVILPFSYIGKALSLSGCLVDKNCLVNTALGSEAIITEPFLIGSLDHPELQTRLAGALSRFTGGLLLALLAPLLVVVMASLFLFRKGPSRAHLHVVALPTFTDETHWRTFPLTTCEAGGPNPATWEARWRHFFLVLLPGLIHVAKGELRLVGIAPRTPDALRSLPPDWRAIALTGKGGLVTEAMLHFGPSPSDDDLYAAETLYTVSQGLRYDLTLLLRYTGQLFGIVPKPSPPEARG